MAYSCRILCFAGMIFLNCTLPPLPISNSSILRQFFLIQDNTESEITYLSLIITVFRVTWRSCPSANINPASKGRATRPDSSNVVFPYSAYPAPGRHSQHRLGHAVTSDLTAIPPPPLILCSSLAPYLTSWHLLSSLASQQHPDSWPRYSHFLLLPGLRITTCRWYHPTYSCRCASYY